MTERDFYAKCWDILVKPVGAQDRDWDKAVFVNSLMRGTQEYRFGGSLGFGGKFYKDTWRVYVSCYPEDRTPERDQVVKEVNKLLEDLLLEARVGAGAPHSRL